jgi:hypothetical protein
MAQFIREAAKTLTRRSIKHQFGALHQIGVSIHPWTGTGIQFFDKKMGVVTHREGVDE